MYIPVSQKINRFYFYDNFGKSGPFFFFYKFSALNAEKSVEEE